MATRGNKPPARTDVLTDEGDRGPIPFPTRRARMTIRPPHLNTVEAENVDASENVNDALEAMEVVSRRMDKLARRLNCLWFYDDKPADDDGPPSAA